MIATVACVLLALGLGVYIFFPERKVAEQREKTRLEYLEEQKAVLYESLRDLGFEHAAGKYSEEEFAAQRDAVEREAAEVIAEIERIERLGRRPAQL